MATKKVSSSQKATTSPAAAAKRAGATPKSAAPKSASAKAPKSTGTQPTASSAAVAPAEVTVGKKAPEFSLPDAAGQRVTSKGLKGAAYVLYFYPKDNTPGCTTEACDFRDQHPEFERLGVRVFGVSPDSERSHAGFQSKHALPFTLLSDPDKVLANAYGVWVLKKNYGREYLGIERSTYLVGADGKVRQIWRPVRVKGHVDAVVEAARAL